MADRLKSIPPQATTATVLTIAGSDPTGGAGIQADLKTLTSLGVYGAAAITCVTVQNSAGVSRIEALPVELVRAQVEAVLADHRVSHIKIGMVGTPDIAAGLGRLLEQYRGEVVYDPVLHATTGQNLLTGMTPDKLASALLEQVNVLTPNLPELAWLTGQTIQTPRDAIEAAQRLLERLAKLRAVLVKGGHGPEEDRVVDHLVLRGDGRATVLSGERERIDSKNTHGTGCTLASVYTGFLSLGWSHEEAFRKSGRYMQTLLRISGRYRIITADTGKGPLLHARLCTPRTTCRERGKNKNRSIRKI